jgi:signal peptidase II
MKFRTSHLTLFTTIATTIALDQWSKWWLLYVVGMIDRPPIVVHEYFSLVMVWNRGVSFGMLNHPERAPYLLIAVALVIAAVLLRMALKSPHRWERIGYGLVIGGAIGNVIDRIRYGAVADFFYAHVGDIGWPAFNVADAAICVGVGILLIMLWRHPSRP